MVTKYDENKIFFKRENDTLVGGGHLITAPTQKQLDTFIAFDSEEQAYAFFELEKPQEGEQ